MEHTPKRGTCDDCSLTWDRRGNVKDVVLCPLHAAAAQLLEALERMRLWVLSDCDINEVNSIMHQARAAITAAKGDA